MNAKLVGWNKIYFDNIQKAKEYKFYIDNKQIDFNVENDYLTFEFNQEILGKDLYLINGNEKIIVSVKECPLFKDFDDKYAYGGSDLGATYQKNQTDFVLWAPLAKKVILRINEQNIEMLRSDRGVYRQTIYGDFDGELYDFLVYIDDEEIISIDPYGKSSNANAEKSAVINFSKLNFPSFSECLPKFRNYVEAIIYETHVRDMTINPNTDIENKGKYLGLTEENRKSIGGNSVGIDYIKDLGITHLQLQPVFDFGSVDEIKLDNYNWGYDPMQFFTLEGSFSTNPNDPYSRMIEFKKLIASCHKNGIRVNLDVVYNHVYKMNNFSLNKITPNYFFRFENGKLSDHSGCGNDFCSERFMARKFIIDSCMYFLNTFDIDGFRFDLMGLLDVDTISKVSHKIKHSKPDAMIYGEGWDMYCVSEYGARFANSKNSMFLEHVAFFNDGFRDIVRGHGSKTKLDSNGFLLGNFCYKDGFKYAYLGTTTDYPFPHMFNDINQSINFVECHDNAALIDVISDSIDIANKENLVDLFNQIVLLSPGVPFIHMGQEFGQSKKFHFNTYNEGDEYNQFDVLKMDNSKKLVSSFKNYIALRKRISLFSNPSTNEIHSSVNFNEYDNILDISINCDKNYHLLINATNEISYLNSNVIEHFDSLISKSNDEMDTNTLRIEPFKCKIFEEKVD